MINANMPSQKLRNLPDRFERNLIILTDFEK